MGGGALSPLLVQPRPPFQAPDCAAPSALCSLTGDRGASVLVPRLACAVSCRAGDSSPRASPVSDILQAETLTPLFWMDRLYKDAYTVDSLEPRRWRFPLEKGWQPCFPSYKPCLPWAPGSSPVMPPAAVQSPCGHLSHPAGTGELAQEKTGTQTTDII